ncbi:MAG: DUF3575 domain-containing protein [Rikenellaceae bacterium]
MKKKLITILFLLFMVIGSSYAGSTRERAQFRFVAGKDMLFSPWGGNGENLKHLTEFINANKEVITSGATTINVNGYCASIGSTAERLKRVRIMSNRVKSALIESCGVIESNFTTKNVATAYNEYRNMVIVDITLPEPKVEAVKEEPKVETVKEEPKEQTKADTIVEQPQEELVGLIQDPIVKPKNQQTGLNLRTNLLMWAALTPNIGLEWRITDGFGLKVDGGWSGWEFDNNNKVYKNWYVNPEVRWYMLNAKRFYLGLGATIGKANIKLSDTGYKGDIYGGGVTVGYQVPMGKCFSWDFNLGLGYVRFNYDTFNVINGERVYKDRDCSKNKFAPTQAGVHFVWHIGK